jgi:hypothetical protein
MLNTESKQKITELKCDQTPKLHYSRNLLNIYIYIFLLHSYSTYIKAPCIEKVLNFWIHCVYYRTVKVEISRLLQFEAAFTVLVKGLMMA